MRTFENSKELPITDKVTNDPIIIFSQFYVDKNADRHKEIQSALRHNCNNVYIDQIILLNEKEYTESELGIKSSKIKQVLNGPGKRLTFADVFSYIAIHNVKAYNVFMNSDIFLDDSIHLLKLSTLHSTRSMMALLRFDFNSQKSNATLFGPRPDSQDTWILHSNNNIAETARKVFDFPFGILGCDNKIVYLMSILGFTIYNDPLNIKTFHLHESNVRNYHINQQMKEPFGLIFPCTVESSLYDSIQQHLTNDKRYVIQEENTKLRHYLANKLSTNTPFVIPRIAGIENIYALMGDHIRKSKKVTNEVQNYIKKTTYSMKNNAGIHITSIESLLKYSDMYMSSFEHADLYADWEPWGAVYNGGQDEIAHKFKKDTIWACVFDIFHFIYSCPWTTALQGKRILLVSPFEESLRKQIAVRKHIFGIDLFPDCTFEFMKPPQTQGTEISLEFDEELGRFYKELEMKTELYDVALVSAGGYGNLICDFIFYKGKSAIYIGGVLQMYFGIYGERWVESRKEIFTLYQNSYWRRPDESERPKNHTEIEKSCYW